MTPVVEGTWIHRITPGRDVGREVPLATEALPTDLAGTVAARADEEGDRDDRLLGRGEPLAEQPALALSYPIIGLV